MKKILERVRTFDFIQPNFDNLQPVTAHISTGRGTNAVEKVHSQVTTNRKPQFV